MPPPSYPSLAKYSTSVPSPPLLPQSSTQSPKSDRRTSEWQSFSNQPRSHQASFSPISHFQQPSNKPSQPSPALPSIFSLQSGTDLTSNRANESTEHSNSHLAIPSAFSPSMFALSPSTFLSESSLAVAPSPPSNPQYATFPFDTTHNNRVGSTQSGVGGTVLTPDAQSHTSGSHTAGSDTGNTDKDPFLSLLEQLAENEHSQVGPSELDFFLTGAVDQDGELGIEEKF